MSNCVELAFQAQIASIMEVLANAAVAEICQVVDDGYAVLRLEMCQYQKENKALKRRLQTMERQTARRCAERGGMRASFADGAQVCRKLRETARAERHFNNFPAVERVFDNRIDVSPRKDERPIVLDEEDAESAAKSDRVTSHQNATSAACADVEEGRTEPVLIKEESLKEKMENSDHEGELRKDDEREVGSEAGDKGSLPSAEMQTASAKQEQPAVQLSRTKHRIWEGSGLECGLEADAEKENIKALQRPGPESKARRLNSLDSEFVMFERPSQLESCCTQGGASTETEDPCCSYSTEVGPQSLSFHSEMRSFLAIEESRGNSLSPLGSLEWKPDIVVVDSMPVKGKGADSSLSLGPLDVKPEAVMIDSAPTEEDAEMGSTQNEETISENIPAQHRYSSKERPFSCQQCGKRFAHLYHFKIHKRIHTGEKPYRCTLCQQQFSRSGNLKRHFRVHTREKSFGAGSSLSLGLLDVKPEAVMMDSAPTEKVADMRSTWNEETISENIPAQYRYYSKERPFSCQQCGKRFAHLYHFKIHKRIHTGEKPYRCTVCHQQFSRSGNLKRHFRVHTGEKPFHCTHCGRCFSCSDNLKKHLRVHTGD